MEQEPPRGNVTVLQNTDCTRHTCNINGTLSAKLSVTSGLVQTGSYVVGGFVIPTRKSVHAVSNNYFESQK